MADRCRQLWAAAGDTPRTDGCTRGLAGGSHVGHVWRSSPPPPRPVPSRPAAPSRQSTHPGGRFRSRGAMRPLSVRSPCESHQFSRHVIAPSAGGVTRVQLTGRLLDVTSRHVTPPLPLHHRGAAAAAAAPHRPRTPGSVGAPRTYANRDAGGAAGRCVL